MRAKIIFIFPLMVMLFVGFASTSYSQPEVYPSKRIQILLPFGAGGGVDIFFRMLSEELKKTWKVPVNIVNQPSGGGSVAASEVANAKKDGYTLFGTLMGLLAAMTVVKPEGSVNMLRDFDPVFVDVGYCVNIMATRSESTFRSLKDVIDYARGKPGELIVGTSPVGTHLYLEAKLLARTAKVDINLIPFTGTSDLVPQLLGGHIHIAAVSEVVARPYVESGRMRAIASVEKPILLSGVPTYADMGYPEINLIPSLGLFGPKGLPPAIIKTWEDALVAITKEQGFTTSLHKTAMKINLLIGNERLNSFLKEEIKNFSQFTPQELGWK